VIRALVLIVLALSVSSCGWISSFTRGKDNLPPPTELSAVDAAFTPSRRWATQAELDSSQQLVRLRPFLDADTLYLAGYNGRVAALEQETGRQRWGSELSGAISGGVGVGEGAVLLSGPGGEVWALDRETGELLWESKVSTEVLSPPVAASGVVVVRSADGQVHGLDSLDGSDLWQYSSSEPALTLRGTSPMILVSGAAIVGLDNGKVAVLDLRSGRAYWERTIAPPQGRNELDRMVDVDAAPALLGNVLYVVTYQGRLVALDVEAGRALWTREVSSYSGLAVDERNVYVTDADGAVLAYDRRSGATLWRQDALAHRFVTGPALQSGYLVVGDFEGYLHWLSPANGAIVARTRHSENPIVVAPVAAGGTLFAYDDRGHTAAYTVP
jgi:outer membrane protein assembly factor BamB